MIYFILCRKASSIWSPERLSYISSQFTERRSYWNADGDKFFQSRYDLLKEVLATSLRVAKMR